MRPFPCCTREFSIAVVDDFLRILTFGNAGYC